MTEYSEDGWHDAGLTAWFAWERVRDAKGLAQACDAMVALSDAMGDLATWLPGWDVDTGTVETEAVAGVHNPTYGTCTGSTGVLDEDGCTGPGDAVQVVARATD